MGVILGLLTVAGITFGIFFFISELVHFKVYGWPYSDQFRKDHLATLTNAEKVHGHIISYWNQDIQMAAVSNSFFCKWAIWPATGSSLRRGCVLRWSKLHYVLEREYWKHKNVGLPTGMPIEDEIVEPYQ